MNLAEQAFEKLRVVAGIKDFRRKIVKYSGHFKNYNANAKYTNHYLQFNLADNWEAIDEDIQQGLIESLMVKIYKIKNIKTENMKLYEDFMKGLSKYAKKHTHDPILESSFHRVNERFFNGMSDKPNLIWAGESFNKLGSYEYSSDTIYISTIFKELTLAEIHFLDYVMYHELLHKKHQFQMKNGRHHAHTTAFREDEAKFGVGMEEELTKWLHSKKKTSFIDWLGF
jgi:hypothetical protein